MPRPPLDLAGRVFGQLTAIEPAGRDGGKVVWLCHCACGETCLVRAQVLASGGKTDCGHAGYRRDAKAHATARKKVPARKRKAIAQEGARARWT